MKEVTFYVPGFHSDAVWLEDQRDYAVSLLGALGQNLMICQQDKDYGVFLHELTYLKPYFDTHPAERELILKLIKEGRIGTGGSYNQPAEKLLGGEGLVRNILYGRLFDEKVLGDKPLIYTPWDVFGHCAQLSQILKKSGFIGCVWSKGIRGFHPLFFHQSLDGSRLLYRRVEYSYSSKGFNNLNKNLRLDRKELISFGLSFDLRLDCADFKPPTAWLAGECARLKKAGIIVSGSGQRKFFQMVFKQIKKKNLSLPVTARDMEYHHQGTALTRVDFKIANRLAENTLLSGEKFATIANLLGAKYPDKTLDKAWRQLLFAHHHDAITGPCCDRVYLDLISGYRESLELSSEVLRNSLGYIGEVIDTKQMSNSPQSTVHSPQQDNYYPIAVFNPLSWKRTDVVKFKIQNLKSQNLFLTGSGIQNFSLRDSQGKEVPYQVEEEKIVFIAQDVPSLGYKVYYLIPEQDAGGQIVHSRQSTVHGKDKSYGLWTMDYGLRKEMSIENEFYKIIVDPLKGGGIISLFDKHKSKELISKASGVGNQIIALEEDPKRPEPPWEVFTTGKKVFSSDFKAKVSIKRGPVSSTLIIEGKFKDCEKIQKITLYRGIKRIDLTTYLKDYSGKNDLLVVTFPTNLKGSVPVFEERFGVVVRNKSKDYLDFRTHQQHNFSECGIRSSYQWMDANYSLLLKFLNKNNQDIASVALGMVGLIVPHNEEVIRASYSLQEKLIKKGIFCTPFFDDGDKRRREKLKEEDSTMPKELNEDLPYGTSFRISLDIKGKNIYSQRLLRNIERKKRLEFKERLKEDGFSYLFLKDKDLPSGWPPLPVLIISAKDGERLKEALLTLTKDLEKKSVINLPEEVRADKGKEEVDNYGLAVLNTGNILNSMEKEGSLVLFLMHTSSWGGSAWGPDRLPFLLVPEWKTHTFPYALYPHSGSWKEAKTYKVGYEYNNPLIAHPLSIHKGPLPQSLSFLKVEPDNLIVTALKPKGNPTASLSRKEAEAKKGIILRLYETEGEKTLGKVNFFKPLSRLYWTNLLEERERVLRVTKGSLSVKVNPFSIETFEFLPQRLKKRLKSKALGREKEVAPIIHFKSWQHNSGAQPLGYCPVAISLEGRIKTGIHIGQGGVTTNVIKLGVSNDYIDKRAKGKVNLILPEGWKAVPQIIYYNLAPVSQKVYPILIAFMGNLREGIIKARIEEGGQTFQDIIEVGKEHLLDWEVYPERCKLEEATAAPLTRTSNGVVAAGFSLRIKVELSNPHQDGIEGEVTLISSLESWPEEEGGEYSLFSITPRAQGFVIPAGDKKTYLFNLNTRGRKLPSFWAVAKLAYNGRVDYKPVSTNPSFYQEK